MAFEMKEIVEMITIVFNTIVKRCHKKSSLGKTLTELVGREFG